MTHKFLKKNLNGFTLIELSIVMIIISLLAGFGLPLLTSVLSQEKNHKTIQHHHHVFMALAAYVLAHNHLPCPANPADTSPDRGLSMPHCSHDTQLCQGLVPYRTLGLTEDQAKDGFKHWMTYAVSPELTTQNIPLDTSSNQQEEDDRFFQRPQAFCSLKDDSLRVLAGHNEDVFENNDQDHLAVVLISHGPKGSGAYKGNGTQERYPTNHPQEAINADDSLIFMHAPYSPHSETGFSHRITWVTRNNLMAAYANRPCSPSNPYHDERE